MHKSFTRKRWAAKKILPWELIYESCGWRTGAKTQFSSRIKFTCKVTATEASKGLKRKEGSSIRSQEKSFLRPWSRGPWLRISKGQDLGWYLLSGSGERTRLGLQVECRCKGDAKERAGLQKPSSQRTCTTGQWLNGVGVGFSPGQDLQLG